jgi:hypothetical protein
LKNPEIALLPEKVAIDLITQIRLVISQDPDFSELLIFDRSSVQSWLDGRDYPSLSKEDQDFADRIIVREVERQNTAHYKFMDAMNRMKLLVLSKLK